jgi:hypothetical protein
MSWIKFERLVCEAALVLGGLSACAEKSKSVDDASRFRQTSAEGIIPTEWVSFMRRMGMTQLPAAVFWGSTEDVQTICDPEHKRSFFTEIQGCVKNRQVYAAETDDVIQRKNVVLHESMHKLLEGQYGIMEMPEGKTLEIQQGRMLLFESKSGPFGDERKKVLDIDLGEWWVRLATYTILGNVIVDEGFEFDATTMQIMVFDHGTDPNQVPPAWQSMVEQWNTDKDVMSDETRKMTLEMAINLVREQRMLGQDARFYHNDANGDKTTVVDVALFMVDLRRSLSQVYPRAAIMKDQELIEYINGFVILAGYNQDSESKTLQN